jgi:RNA polymerase sigma-70 factor (ECF subfamily)
VATENNKYNEVELLVELAEGSATAFDILYYRYYEPVRANIFKILRDDAATDDLLQEVFISLWERRKKFAGSEKISGWLFVSSYNRAMNFLRRKVTEQVYKKSLMEEKEYMEDTVNDSLQEEQYRLLEEAIAQLPPQRKRVFELCRFHGKTYEQTAAELSISKNTVKDHLSEASDSIRRYIQNHHSSSIILTSLMMIQFFKEI